MFKKILCLLLAGLMLTSTVACATESDTDTLTDQQTTASAEEIETDLKPDLPKKDYSSSTFRVLGIQDAVDHVLSEKTKGEEVNDALVAANLQVASQFNTKFESIIINHDEDTSIIRAFIMSGDDGYDVAYLHDCATANMALEGWFVDVNTLPYLEPTALWWPQFTVESLTLNRRMYYYSNYTSYLAMEWTWGCFFNQDILREFNQENPYDAVRKGTWTLDKIHSMSTSIYSDKNGDGLSNDTDILGFAFTQTPYAWLESFGIEVWKKESPDSAVLTLDIEDERCYTLIDKLHTWFYSGEDSVMVNFSGPGGVDKSMFTGNRLAFTFERIGTLAPAAMEADISYGIVPLPKLDANQADYYAGCHDKLFSVPTTVNDRERVGIILEAMAYEGYKHILPAYCEKTLKTRLATDPDCGEMLNMIFERQVISFAYLLNRQVSGGGIQINLIPATAEQNNVASFLKSKQAVEKKILKKITKFYEKDPE